MVTVTTIKHMTYLNQELKKKKKAHPVSLKAFWYRQP